MLKQLLAVVAGTFFAHASVAGEPYQLESDAGLYKLHLTPNVSEVVIGELHSWHLRIADTNGEMIDGAKVLVDGGMPAHGHGLPTAPKVTESDETGRYFIEGLRFNMPGKWEIQLEIEGTAGFDTAKLELRL